VGQVVRRRPLIVCLPKRLRGRRPVGLGLHDLLLLVVVMGLVHVLRHSPMGQLRRLLLEQVQGVLGMIGRQWVLHRLSKERSTNTLSSTRECRQGRKAKLTHTFNSSSSPEGHEPAYLYMRVCSKLPELSRPLQPPPCVALA
jgi:hypothetical protein